MNKLLITLIIILFPGVIATIIAGKITFHSKWDSFKYGLYSFVLGVCTYGVLQIFVYIYNMFAAGSVSIVTWTHLDVWSIAIKDTPQVSPWEICLAAVLAIPVAFFASWLINHKVFNKLAQNVKASTKYGDENLFSYYLNAKEIDWVYIRDLENQLTYQGRIVSYSENDEIQEVVLSDVTVFAYQDSSELYSVPSIYLSREIGKFIIEAVPTDYLGVSNDKKAIN
jgi:ABC-type multidrug transport system fused ATPase/permease subunit